MAEKDFYKILGVADTASADEIKKAYRKLAKRYHPDATGGDKTKEARFKELTEANETLSDPKKRAEYDEFRRNPYAGMRGGGRAPGGGPVPDLNEILNRMRSQVRQDRAQQQQQRRQQGRPNVRVETEGGGFHINDFFSEIFGGAAGAEQQAQGRAAPREDHAATLEVDLPEAALGAEKEIAIDGKHLKVRIPAGVTDGKTIRLGGQGGHGGDLLLQIKERPHAVFRRRSPGSADIEVDLPVDLETAVCGGKAEVSTLEGTRVALTIPPGTASGKKLRLRQKGARQAGTDTRGDLYAEVLIQIPASPSERAKELARELQKELVPAKTAI
jgi:curved DNA-binding protein